MKKQLDFTSNGRTKSNGEKKQFNSENIKLALQEHFGYEKLAPILETEKKLSSVFVS